MFKIYIKKLRPKNPYWKQTRKYMIHKDKRKEENKFKCRKEVNPDD